MSVMVDGVNGLVDGHVNMCTYLLLVGFSIHFFWSCAYSEVAYGSLYS